MMWQLKKLIDVIKTFFKHIQICGILKLFLKISIFNVFSDSSFLIFYLFIFRERGRERNIDVREKHQLVASRLPPTRDLVCNPGMYPDWELNRQPFGLQDSAQPTELHQSGLCCCCCCWFLKPDSFLKLCKVSQPTFSAKFEGIFTT